MTRGQLMNRALYVLRVSNQRPQKENYYVLVVSNVPNKLN